MSRATLERLMIWTKLVVFGSMNFVIFLTNCWTTMDLDYIIKVNLQVPENRMSSIASLMYSSFFYGMLVSCFLWPALVRYFSKRSCILSSFMLVAGLNLACAYYKNVWFIIFCRFMSGVFQNIHTVGKDFLFDEFTHADAKTGLILDSCFSLFGNTASLFLIKASRDFIFNTF